MLHQVISIFRSTYLYMDVIFTIRRWHRTGHGSENNLNPCYYWCRKNSKSNLHKMYASHENIIALTRIQMDEFMHDDTNGIDLRGDLHDFSFSTLTSLRIRIIPASKYVCRVNFVFAGTLHNLVSVKLCFIFWRFIWVCFYTCFYFK